MLVRVVVIIPRLVIELKFYLYLVDVRESHETPAGEVCQGRPRRPFRPRRLPRPPAESEWLSRTSTLVSNTKLIEIVKILIDIIRSKRINYVTIYE
mgnify:CR=1 FL=1